MACGALSTCSTHRDSPGLNSPLLPLSHGAIHRPRCTRNPGLRDQTQSREGEEAWRPKPEHLENRPRSPQCQGDPQPRRAVVLFLQGPWWELQLSRCLPAALIPAQAAVSLRAKEQLHLLSAQFEEGHSWGGHRGWRRGIRTGWPSLLSAEEVTYVSRALCSMPKRTCEGQGPIRGLLVEGSQMGDFSKVEFWQARLGRPERKPEAVFLFPDMRSETDLGAGRYAPRLWQECPPIQLTSGGRTGGQ